MAAKQTNRVWGKSPYSQNLLVLHLAIADEANNDGVMEMSHKAMAAKTRSSVSTVKRNLTQMKVDGMIDVIRTGGQHKGDVSVYQLTWPTKSQVVGRR